VEFKKKEYGLHWMRRAHERLWLIGERISDEYQGDARRVWEGEEPDAREVLDRLWALGAGNQISRMIVGALKDCGLVAGPSDVKADVYVCRVLGRALEGAEVKDAERAVVMARKLYPADPWQLDWALWHFGEAYCHTNSPNCSACPLAPHCAFAAEERSETEVVTPHLASTQQRR
jgi:endonuclease III